MAISDGGHGQDTSTGFCIASASGGVDLSLLVNNSQLADTQIQCSNGDTLVGHAAILSLQSEWFRQQLATKHEGNEKGADMFRFRFSLPANAPTCLLVLRFLYTSKATIPDSSVLSVLRLASFLGIKQLANQCAAYFERKLLSPASAILYADFLFYLKELGGDYGITDSEAAFVKVSACLKRDVQLATNSFESRQILSTFTGDQICDLCTLINSESLVVWLLCLSWIHSVHSSPSSSTETLVSTEPTLIPSENLLAAKQDLQDLLLLLNLHSFTLQEYTTHLEPHLYLLHAKPRTRVESHYSKLKSDAKSRRTSLLGDLFSSTLLTQPQSTLLLSHIQHHQRTLPISIRKLYAAPPSPFSNAKFHTACNSRGPTLTLVHLESGAVVGGYTDKSWSSDSLFHTSHNAFLFSFPSATSTDLKVLTIKEGQEGYATLGSMVEAVYFGQRDLVVDNDACSSCLSVYGNENGAERGRGLVGSGDFVDMKVLEMQVFTTVWDGMEWSDDE